MSQKILFLNFLYGLGSNGSFDSYVRNGIHYLLDRERQEKEVNMQLRTMIEKKKPDICCFVEIKTDSKLHDELAQYPFHYIQNKYSSKFVRALPFLKHNGNGFFSKHVLFFRTFYLQYGIKRLVVEICLQDDITLVLVHLSLKSDVRQKQFFEILQRTRGKKRTVICGDFNIFRGLEEITMFQKAGFCLPQNLQPTFPSCNPRYFNDFILTTQDVKVRNYQTVTACAISDHTPIIFEVL